MAHSFDVLDLLSLLLAALAVSFMAWVFWSLNAQIKREKRSRMAPTETLWTPEPSDRLLNTREHVYSGPESHLQIPEKAVARHPGVEPHEQRFAPRIVR